MYGRTLNFCVLRRGFPEDFSGSALKYFSKIMASASSNEQSTIKLRNIFAEAIKSVQPSSLIGKQIKCIDGHLYVNNVSFPAKTYYAVGFGKAVLGMATELDRVLGDNLERAILTIPKGIFEKHPEYSIKNSKILCFEGAENNIPDEAAMKGAIKIKELAESLDINDLLIVLISGGGSALLPLPIPPVSLEEKQQIVRSLSRGGASIQELNIVRKHLSLLKGGGLAKIAFPAQIVSLILSDVVGDPLDIIASGPTVYTQENPQDAIRILKKYGMYEDAPQSIRTILESQANNSGSCTSKGIDDSASADQGQFNKRTPCTTTMENSTYRCSDEKFYQRVSNFIIGTNRIATEAAKRAALAIGWQCVTVSSKVTENVDYLSDVYAQLALYLMNGKIIKIKELLENVSFEVEDNAIQDILGLYGSRGILLIFAGEPTVKVSGSGKGGRNQHLALSFSLKLDTLQETEGETENFGNIFLLAAGTDGIDGPTDAAGAIGSSELTSTCAISNLNPKQYLINSNSNMFFSLYENGDNLIKIGHTGTNVMDLHFLFIEPRKQTK